MTLILWVAGLTLFVALYVTVIRPWMRNKPWAQGYFKFFEPMENLWKKSETILFARWNQLMGLILMGAGFLGGIDYSILHPIVPEKYQPFLPMIPVALNMLGGVIEALRRDTTKPLEVVAAPEEKAPEVIAAIEKAEAATNAAVTEIAIDKEMKKAA